MRPENLQLRHIAATMKISEEEVSRLAESPRIAFKQPQMRPVEGKMRLITAPRRKWKMPYKWLGIFLRREFPLHPAAHGSVPGRSPFTAASRHVGPTHLLSRDIKNAFPNVTSDRFYLEMLALGFFPDIARLLTKLLLPDGYIPQGGPAANAAIDLFFYRFDCDVERDLSVQNARYTRFTDNLDTSFASADAAPAVSAVLDAQLSRLGLTINQKKMAEMGWQPSGQEQVMCGVRVDSSRGTQLPSRALSNLLHDCEALYRGACSAAPHTLVGLAARRRAVQGWLNQASQADDAPVREIQRRLHQVDFVIRTTLNKCSISPNRQWYVRGSDYDTATELASAWRQHRRFLAAAAVA